MIATKFPSYGIRHPNKVVWLVHQFRQAYDYDRTEFGQFSESPDDRATRLAVERFDAVALGEARRIFTISGNVADRLKRYSGFDAQVLPPPPQKLDYRTDGYGGFVLSVNRLDRAKRIDLLIEAAKAEPGLRVVIVGDGPDRGRLEQLASGLDGRDRVHRPRRRRRGSPTSTRAASPSTTRRVDEDYGMVPYEAFLSAKPVVTTARRGRPARGRARPRDGARRRARAGRARARPAPTSPRTRTRRRALGEAGQGRRRAHHLGRLHRRAAL